MGSEIKPGKYERARALEKICRAIGGTSNLSPTDFANISVSEIKQKFPQDTRGVMVQFCISRHAWGKAIGGDPKVSEALEILLEPRREIEEFN